MKITWGMCFRALIFCVSMTAAWGQGTGSGTINGTIRDPNQALVPDASVTVHNISTNVDRVVQTNDVGLYAAPFLPPGDYEVTAAKTGFSKLLRKNVHLEVGQTLTLDLTLAVQGTTETVTVTADTPVVDAEKTDMSQVVSQIGKDNLPMAGRNWANFQFATPNVTNDGTTGLAAYRGVSGLYNSSNVDGTNNNQAFFSEQKGRTTLPYVYSIDSIQEYQVASSNYSAELGRLPAASSTP